MEETLSIKEEDELVTDALSHLEPDSFLPEETSTGIISFISDSVAVIDNKYFFHMKDASSDMLSVGDFVKFRLKENELNVLVQNVQKVPNPDTALTKMPISHLNSDYDDKKFFKLNVTGTVTKRLARNVFVQTEDVLNEVTFSLDQVSAEFIPIQGDLVILEGLVDLGEKNKFLVKKISPKATAIKAGIVSKWSVNEGVINNFSVFQLDSCEPGYIPSEGDKVLASLIRVVNSKGYTWRAIQVINQSSKVQQIPKQLKQYRKDLVINKKGIYIPVVPKFTLKLNTLTEFNVEIENFNNFDLEVLSVSPWPVSNDSQISLVSPKDKCKVLAKQKLNFVFQIEARFIGYTSVEYKWNFFGFYISRMYEVEVICSELDEISDYGTNELPGRKKKLSAMNLLDQTSGCIIPGQKKYFRNTIFPVKLYHYSVPEKILFAALPAYPMSFEDLLLRVENVIPCLKGGLSPSTYSQYFSGLLFLEEVEHLREIGDLKIERAHFRRSGDYLILDVPRFSPYSNKLIAGDKVIASLPWDGGNYKFEGIIHKISQNEIWIKFSHEFHDSYQARTEYSISFVTSRVCFRKMHQAVTLAMKYLGGNWLFPTGVELSPPQITFDLAPLSDICVAKNKMISPINWNKYGSGYGANCTLDNVADANFGTISINKIEWFNRTLNEEQKNAVKNVLIGVARPLPYIIFGPPGTGKSMTVVESILQLNILLSNSRILVAAPSNSAADLLTVRLLEMGTFEQKDILRLAGSNVIDQGRIAASIIPYAATVDSKINAGDQNLSTSAIGREALSQFKVIVGTIGCTSILFNLGFPRGYFTHIFIDEAGQATEPEILMILIMLNTKNGQVILAGDPFQLGPVVLSKVATKYGLDDSFLVRLLDRFPYKKDSYGFPNSYGYDPRLVTKLINNYRSLPPILQLFNTLFYDDHLIANITEELSKEGNLLRTVGSSFLLKTPQGSAPPIIFHGIRGTNHQLNNSCSWFNPQEVYQVFTYINMLYKAGVSPNDIGIITPYQLQCLKIRQMLEQLNIEPPKIGSVEEFQGQEKMIIILSVVRSSFEFVSFDAQRALGFVRCPRRLNVALSRARALLIIIGNPHLLQFDKMWKKTIKYCLENNYYTGCDLPVNLM